MFQVVFQLTQKNPNFPKSITSTYFLPEVAYLNRVPNINETFSFQNDIIYQVDGIFQSLSVGTIEAAGAATYIVYISLVSESPV